MNIYYGITEDLTIKAGGYNAGDEEREENYLNLSPTLRIGGRDGWSHLITGDYSQNTSREDEGYYRILLTSGNGMVSSATGYERYRNTEDSFIGDSYHEKFYWRGRFPMGGVNTSLSYELEKNPERDEKVHRYGVTMYDSFFMGRISSSMSISKESVNRDSYGSGRDSRETATAVSYNFSRKEIVRYLDTAGVEYEGDSRGDSTYGFYLQRRSKRDRNLDYYLRVRKEGGAGFGELSVSYRFGDKFRIRSNNYRNRDGSNTYGADISTAVNLGAPEKKVHYSEYMGDSNIRGVVYIDRNNNGIRDPGEAGIGDFEISRGGKRYTTSEEGGFFIPAVYSGSAQSIGVRNMNEELLNYDFEEEYLVKTLPGGDMQMEIPIVPLKTLVGMVEFGRDLYLEEVRAVLEDLRGIIYPAGSESGEAVGIRDEYFIRELPPGDYIIELNYRGDTQGSYRFIVGDDEDELEEYLDIRVFRGDEGYIFEVI